jgi:transcription initiation factor TFIID subunit 15
MRFSTIVPVLLAAGFANAQFGQNNGQNNGQNGGNCLNPNVISKNANNDGSANAEAGQAKSATDANNFINFCAGKTITDGLQVKGGSCNPIRECSSPPCVQCSS